MLGRPAPDSGARRISRRSDLTLPRAEIGARIRRRSQPLRSELTRTMGDAGTQFSKIPREKPQVISLENAPNPHRLCVYSAANQNDPSSSGTA